MKLTFLGTGTSQGVPVIGCRCKVCTSADRRDNRLRTSAMVSPVSLAMRARSSYSGLLFSMPKPLPRLMRTAPNSVSTVSTLRWSFMRSGV